MSAMITAPAQETLTLELEPDVLERVPWRRRVDDTGATIGALAGVMERYPFDANALLNDLRRAGIKADIRLDAEAFAELLRDEHRPTRGMSILLDPTTGTPHGCTIEGPGPEEYEARDILSRSYRPGTHRWTFTTGAWQQVPAFVAYWFAWAQRDDARLGAGYSRNKTRDERDPDESRNAVQPVPGLVARMQLQHEIDPGQYPAPRELFAIRLPCERAPGERVSDLVVPGEQSAAELAAARERIKQLESLLAMKQPRNRGQEG